LTFQCAARDGGQGSELYTNRVASQQLFVATQRRAFKPLLDGPGIK
jgi:hypothetical protein